MNKFEKREPNPNLEKLEYIQAYQRIKSRCQFQINFSGFLLIVFFMLQYSVPIFLVVLGSVASSRDQLATFFPLDGSDSNLGRTAPTSEVKKAPASEVIVSRIIYLIGLITILLGVINNIVRPAESYDIAARYNNKFSRFEQNFSLSFLEALNFPDEIDKKDTAKIIINFLLKKMMSFVN